MENKLKFALIGCGRIGERHAQQVIKNGQLSAVCDIDAGKAREFAQKYNTHAYYNIQNLLADAALFDVAAVCTPNGLHAVHSIAAMKAGMHVLCEKPMAITAVDAQEMINTSRQTGQQLFVVKQNRFNAPVVYVKKLIETGALKNIHSFQLNCFWNRPAAYFTDDWRGTLAMDGGTLYTQFSHFIDLLYWLCGDVVACNGIRNNYMHKNIIEFEDTGTAWLQLANGATGTLHYSINAYSSNMEGSLTIFAENGTVKIGGQYLNELEYFKMEGAEAPPVMEKQSPANQYGFYTGSMSNHHLVYKNLVMALQQPGYSFINMEETLKSVEIIEKIYQNSPLQTL